MADRKYEVGQLLEIKEKNNKLVRDYVAGFFGDEPIIKQRLLTPVEARIYREDLKRGKITKSGTAPKPGGKKLKRRLKRRVKVKRPGVAVGKPGEERSGSDGGQDTAGVSAGPASSTEGAPDMKYIPEASDDLRSFVEALVEKEQDKSGYMAENIQAAIDEIGKIGSPNMKIYRIGVPDSTVENTEGLVYTQKEYIARKKLGLPIWKNA